MDDSGIKLTEDEKNELYAQKPELNTDQKNKNASRSKAAAGKYEATSTVRVDINRLDNLMNMVGELLINKTRLESLQVEADKFHDILSQLDRVTMELHHIVMQIRMVPIAVMFNRFPRIVRDLAKNLGKEIDFVINGQDTELDRSIIDELSDPLIHILRNAIDHGLENPGERQKKNKPGEGKLILRAYQKGSEIIIEIEDDGRGVDIERLTKKAVNKGIITTQQAEELDKDEKLKLLFEPGLSTAENVSDVSGQGVGMDVVKKVIEKLDGQISIDTKKNVGSRVTITLPLTLAITDALMVKVNKEIFAIPLAAVSETLQVKTGDIKKVKGQEIIVLRGKTVSLIEGRKKLNLQTEYGLYTEKEEFPVVIINSGERKIGLIVDELLNQQEIVIKSLSEYLNDTKNISGATIIGDGEIALILDVRNIA